MKQNYFIVVLAHSIHGRLRRIHIPHQAIYGILGLAVLGCFSLFGFVSSYVRMALKVSSYNALKQEAEVLRSKYQNLQKIANQTDEQLATLKLNAKEVSLMIGVKKSLIGPTDISTEGRLVPTFSETLEEYDALKATTFARFDRSYMLRLQRNTQPNIWPIDGRLMGPFGRRSDPFSGEGAMHTGVDISAPMGTPVKSAADGVVSYAQYYGGYGKLVVITHNTGMQTYYAHLSKFDVIAGQEIRQGELVGRVGSTGRVTAPHLHYEVRVGGVPVNPYRFLVRTVAVTQPVKSDFPF
ncbi:MAG TPA: M23 family metallopeptidase [Bryobacteraceae bacterium]|jgi:murein DD-endopeptidase MepM/ murein hydrolase activator NlpD|nr:M23 family metallopeptidase [Bryobacteraceae bacterium]